MNSITSNELFAILKNNIHVLFSVILLVFTFYIGKAQDLSSNDSLKNLLGKTNNIKNAKSLALIADKYQKAEKYSEAIDYYEKALSIYRLNKDTLSEADALFNIGRDYSLLSEFDKATIFLIKALKQYEQNKNPEGISKTLNSLGITYEHCLNKEKALDCYLRSYKICKIYKNAKGLSDVLNNIGTFYLTGYKNYKKALEYLQESLSLSRSINDTTRSIPLQNIALAYLGMKKYDTALNYFMMALKIDEKFNFKRGIASNYCNVANLYIKINKPDEAKKYLDRSLVISQEINSKGLIRIVYNLYTLYYAIKGNINKMWEYADKSEVITNTLYNDEGKKLIAEMQTKYETEKKEQEIKILNVENKLKESKLRTRSFLLLGLFIAFLFIITFIFQKRRLLFAHRSLVQKNLEIVESESKLISSVNENPIQYENILTESPSEQAIKYTSSQLTDEQKVKIKELIINYFNGSKNYLQKDYSINELANDLKINRNYVSQVINEKFNQNFSCFLNEYRIKEARKIMSESSNLKYTIESIAESVGYKSKTAFNNAFKKYVGVTPSFYLNSIRSNKI